MTAWALFVLGAGALAAYWDLRWRRIPRVLSVPAFFIGLIHAGVAGSLGSALAAGLLGLLLGLALLQLDAFGGGDAKWLAATGTLLGLHLWLSCLTIAVLIAAAWGLIQVVRSGRLAFLPADLAAIVRGWFRYGLRPHPQHRLARPEALAAPFGVAMGIALACVLLH